MPRNAPGNQPATRFEKNMHEKDFVSSDVCFCSILLRSCTLVIMEASVFPLYVYLMVVRPSFPG